LTALPSLPSSRDRFAGRQFGAKVRATEIQTRLIEAARAASLSTGLLLSNRSGFDPSSGFAGQLCRPTGGWITDSQASHYAQSVVPSDLRPVSLWLWIWLSATPSDSVSLVEIISNSTTGPRLLNCDTNYRRTADLSGLPIQAQKRD